MSDERLRRYRVPVSLAATGLVLLVVVVLVAAGSGFRGDPHETVLDAVEASLAVPVAADVDLDVDLGRLAELSREGSGAALSLRFLTGRVSLSGRATVADDTVLVDLRRGGDDALAVRLDTGAEALARVDPDALPSLPFLGLLERTVPGLFGGAWVAVPALDRALPAPTRLAAEVTDASDAVGALDPDTWRDETTVTYLGEEPDGWRFRVVPGVPQAVSDEREHDGVATREPDYDVWVADGRIARLRVDAGPFVAAGLAGVEVRGREGALLVDLRPVDADVPPRPEPEGFVDLDALPSLPSPADLLGRLAPGP